jgi:cell division septal protein FtsQ
MARSRARRKTTALQRNVRQGGDLQRLHIKVSSPRIVMYQVMRGMGKSLKGLIALMLLAVIVLGSYRGVQSLFLDNEKYKLQEIDLQTNGYLDHARVVDLAGIDLEATIFAVNIEDVRERLSDLPEVVQCEVQRRLPGTLQIKIQERVPVAWVQCESVGFLGRQADGVLIDGNGITFPCEGAMWQASKTLPVIIMNTAKSENFNHGTKAKHVDLMRALDLMKTFSEADVRDEWLPEQITLINDYSMELVCNNESAAIFGMYDHKRQVENYITIHEHSLAENRKSKNTAMKQEIKKMNLMPRVNIPVEFKKQPAQLEEPVLIKPRIRTTH